jgi:anti-sigma factor RsiW
MNEDELSKLIRHNATRHRAGEQLRASVRTQLALHSAARSEPVANPVGRWRRWRDKVAGWSPWISKLQLGPGAMAGFAGGVLLTLALGWLLPQVLTRQSLPEQLVAGHVRSMKVGPLFEVASSDRHTVKPWFQGKLDYAPAVADLDADGFPLLGGRIEQVAGNPVAALVYASRLHTINVFVWPSKAEQSPLRSVLSGFNLLHWSDGGMQVWVVSDLEAAEIDRFGERWRNRLAGR